MVGQEDCLRLTVRTPDVSGDYPVMVWIHGGSLMTGWSDEAGYAPTAEFTADVDLVTVNINYRLDLMGFFSAPEIWNDLENPGNYGNFGIGDAITALQWVKANIAQFGGNPDRVTILGESSGGTISLGLLVADQADGLFNKAIIMSAPAKWESTYIEAHERRASFVSDVGCTQSSEAERRTCLKQLDVESLIKHVDVNRGWGFYDFPLSEGRGGESMDYNVIEPTLIKVSPSSLAERGNTRDKGTPVEVVLSSTAQETGYNPLVYGLNVVTTWDSASAILEARLQNLREITGFKPRRDLQEDIEDVYNFGKDKTGEWWPQIYYDTLCTDLRTTCLTNQLTRDLNKNPLYAARRLYIRSRPDELSNEVPYDTVHGWDTEAMFGFGYFNLSSSKKRHQRKFEENIRDLIEYVCKGKRITGWETGFTLTMENKDFPFAIRVKDKEPQEEKCEFWEEEKALRWGWQN